jgi:hypothetical protein
MKKLILICMAFVASSAAHANIQRCVGMKPDSKRLACFDEEVKAAPFAGQGSAKQQLVARRAVSSDMTCHTGPRGGRYRIVNGHKRYGC